MQPDASPSLAKGEGIYVVKVDFMIIAEGQGDAEKRVGRLLKLISPYNRGLTGVEICKGSSDASTRK